MNVLEFITIIVGIFSFMILCGCVALYIIPKCRTEKSVIKITVDYDAKCQKPHEDIAIILDTVQMNYTKAYNAANQVYPKEGV